MNTLAGGGEHVFNDRFEQPISDTLNAIPFATPANSPNETACERLLSPWMKVNLEHTTFYHFHRPENAIRLCTLAPARAHKVENSYYEHC